MKVDKIASINRISLPLKCFFIYFIVTSVLYEKPKAIQVAETYKVQCSSNKKNT